MQNSVQKVKSSCSAGLITTSTETETNSQIENIPVFQRWRDTHP